MAEVQLTDVVKTFGDVVAVAGVSLTVEDAEIVVLVGPSGCGKTTTLRMIAGLESITAGDVFIGARRVNDVAPSKRDIAMVFQNFALYPHMTARENMAFGLESRRLARGEIDKKLAWAADLLSIGHLLARKPGEMSGGQKQRVALGRAIVRDPAVLLMDEPLSNLDAQLRVQMRLEIKKLARELKTTTVYVTHDQVEAMTLGDRVVVMNGGELEQVARPAAIYDRPASIFVARLIGSPAMNLLDGEIVRNNDKVSVLAGGCEFPLPESVLPQGSSTANGRVTVGIRPEAIRVSGVASNGAPSTNRGTLEVIEPQGPDTILVIGIGGTRLYARVDRDHAFRESESVSVQFDPHHVRLFDHATGKLLA